MNKEAKDVLRQAKSLVVSTVSDRQRAADLWDAIRAFRKQATTQKSEVCAPLKKAWDSAKAPYDEFIKECESYEARLNQLMGDYDREVDRVAKIEQAKIEAKIAKANEKIIQKAEAKGVEAVLKETPVVPTAPKSIETQAGTKQTRQIKVVYSVVETPQSIRQLMQDFPSIFVVDKVTFNKVAKTGCMDGHPSVKRTEEYVYVQRQAGSGGGCDFL